MAVVFAVIRLVQRQSLRYVLQAVIPTAIAAFVATRTGRAEDVFLPGILYNGALAVLSLITSVLLRGPLVGFVIGAAVGDPTGWRRDRGLVADDQPADPGAGGAVRDSASPSSCRCSWPGNVVWLAVAKVALGWPLLIAALFVIGLMLSKGRTPIDGRLDDRPERRSVAASQVWPAGWRSSRPRRSRRGAPASRPAPSRTTAR